MTGRLDRFADWLERQLARGGDVDGRWIAAAAVGLYFVGVAVARAGWDVDLWRALGVPSAPFLFFDTHNLTAAGECIQRGLDPFLDNPCDAHDRPWNYSRLWLGLAWLGMDDSWRVALGVGHVAAFLGTAWWLVGRLTAGQGVVVALLAVSPAFMLAVERGQADLVVFALVALAAVAWRAGATGQAAQPAPVLLASMLKLFPAVALVAAVLSRHARSAVAAVVAGVVFVGWFLANLDEMQLISERAPQGLVYSYGARILVGHVARRLVDVEVGGGWARQVVAAGVLVLIAAGVVLWVRRSAAWHAPAGTGPVGWRLQAFHLGALIYVGSFAVANNWDYRLIFLLLVLPQVFAWLRDRDDPRRRLAAVAVPTVVVQCYLGAVLAWGTLETVVDWGRLPTWRIADELVSWLLAGVLLALLVPSVRAALVWVTGAARTGGSRRPDHPDGRTGGSR